MTNKVMDIVEFTEMIYGVKLTESQKIFLRLACNEKDKVQIAWGRQNYKRLLGNALLDYELYKILIGGTEDE